MPSVVDKYSFQGQIKCTQFVAPLIQLRYLQFARESSRQETFKATLLPKWVLPVLVTFLQPSPGGDQRCLLPVWSQNSS